MDRDKVIHYFEKAIDLLKEKIKKVKICFK